MDTQITDIRRSNNCPPDIFSYDKEERKITLIEAKTTGQDKLQARSTEKRKCKVNKSGINIMTCPIWQERSRVEIPPVSRHHPFNLKHFNKEPLVNFRKSTVHERNSTIKELRVVRDGVNPWQRNVIKQQAIQEQIGKSKVWVFPRPFFFFLPANSP